MRVKPLGLASDVGELKLYVVKVTGTAPDGAPLDVAIVAGPYTDDAEARAAGDELANREPDAHFRVIGSVEDLHLDTRDPGR